MNTEYKKIGEQLKVGDYVKAISECRMDDYSEWKTLTIGKLYKITVIAEDYFDVIDDEGDAHGFYFKNGGEFFEDIL